MIQKVDIELDPKDSTEDKVSTVFDALIASGMPIEVAARVAESLVTDIAQRERVLDHASLMWRKARTLFALSAVLFGFAAGQTIWEIIRWLTR